MTYTNRTLKAHTVLSVDTFGESRSITTTDSSGFSITRETADLIEPGDQITVETRKGYITGLQIVGKSSGDWQFRKTDEELDSEHAAFLAHIEARNAELLETNRAEWSAREERLPEWLKIRLFTFHMIGKENFLLNGWGYELAVCELALLYVESNGTESSEVAAYAEAEGTSGNQHSFAQMLARAHIDSPNKSLANTVSALSPITGSSFYSA